MTRTRAAGASLRDALHRRDRQVLLLALAGVVATLIGVFAVWATADTYSLSGVEGPQNGWLALLFALVGAGIAPAVARGWWLGIAASLLVAAVVLTTVIDSQEVAGLDTGWGYWLTLAGGALIAAAGLLALAERVRAARAPGPRSSDPPDQASRP